MIRSLSSKLKYMHPTSNILKKYADKYTYKHKLMILTGVDENFKSFVISKTSTHQVRLPATLTSCFRKWNWHADTKQVHITV